MTESQLERLLDKLEEIRCGIIDVETEAQGIRVLVQQSITQVKSVAKAPAEHICPSCNGTGKPSPDLIGMWSISCPSCNGTGKRLLT